MTTAFIQKDQRGRLESEHAQVQEVLESRGVSVQQFELNGTTTLGLSIPQTIVVMGDHDAMQIAFQQLNVKIPTLSCYPDSVRKYLRRRVMQTTVKIFERNFGTGQDVLGSPNLCLSSRKKIQNCLLVLL